MTGKRIGDQAVSQSVEGVALIHQRVHEELAIVIGEGLGDDGLSTGIFGRDLVECYGNPFADGEIGKAGAHRRVTDDDAVELGGVTLGEDHSFAAAG